MTIRKALRHPDSPSLGSFALVTYLPDPLATFLTELCQLVPGDSQPHPHVTFLPPRPLNVSVEIASCEIQKALRTLSQFEVELGSVRVFPGTNIVYVSIESGINEILNLHGLLNQGSLYAKENFEYIPHLTLGGPIDPLQAAGIVKQAEHLWKGSKAAHRFRVDDLVFLWQPCNGPEREWTRKATYALPKLTQT